MKCFGLRSLTGCLLALACFSQVFALPGDRDQSFNNGQGYYERLFYVGFYTGIYGTTIQPDGKIVFAGFANLYPKGFTEKPTLERLMPNGTMDGSFGLGGVAEYYPPWGILTSIAVQPDGKLVVSGYTHPTPSFQSSKYLLMRTNPDGSLDTTFNGSGRASDSFDAFSDFSFGNKVLLRPDGRIIIAGSYRNGANSYEFAAAQYNNDGTLDTSFGRRGIVKILVGGAASSAALQPDGKLVLAGTNTHFTLVRLLPNGSLDSSFGTGGKVQTPMGSGASSLASIKIQPDGKIVAVGTGEGGSGGEDFAIARYNTNGSLDPLFGAGGRVFRDFTSNDDALDVDLQNNGKIVVAGHSITYGPEGPTSLDWRLARYYPNGSPDLTFGQGGATISFPDRYNCRNVRIAPDGGIILAGGGITHLATRVKGRERADTVRFDFDGDGKADISGFRPSNSNWNLLRSTSGATSIHWGLPTDTLVPADYDGDGKTNVAVYRDGVWKIVWLDGSYHQVFHGEEGDVPRPGDFDGDGKADIAVWRPWNGTWYWISSSDGQYRAAPIGTLGDVPLIADFDGDGQTDFAVFRPSEGNWYYLKSTTGEYAAVHFGMTGDVPLVGDFDGDGKTDLSVYRPSNSFWYRLDSSNGQYFATRFGTDGDIPVAADYDGDNKADLAVFRPSNSVWYILKSSNGLVGILYGTAGDKPIPSVFLP